ncbi:hypothetical protein [Legionella yabuuchiae]|uniref:hypothetical protein n=1 Tax=Legionella yabuuchiae TaxID=376727 RepID=UPI001054CE03|nr:hypothetical protein [Legionella yabuuchiae]
MPTLLNEFYYKLTTSQASFTSVPSGDLDLDRFLAGNNQCWVSQDPAEERKLKTLIVNDWSYKNWGDEQKDAFQQLAAQLRNQGFNLYGWNGEDIVPFNPLPVLKKTIITSAQEVLSVAAEKPLSLAKDQVLILDYGLIRALLSDDRQKRNEILLSDLCKLSKEEQQAVLDLALKKATTVVYDLFSEVALELMSWLTEKQTTSLLPLTIKKNIKHIHLTRNLNATRSFLTPEKIQNVLNLDDCGNPQGDTQFKTTQFETLDLRCFNITSSALVHLLQTAPTLKDLNLHGCNTLKGDLNLQANQLQALETLDLSHSSITLPALAQLLHAAPKLKRLRLWGYKNLQDAIPLERNQLQALETLELTYSRSITSPALTQLLHAAPNLKVLDLIGCEHLTGDIYLHENQLQMLETLNLSHSSITPPALAQLLHAAPNLKVLDLIGCEHLIGDINLQANQLQALETLRLSDSSINSSALAIFLQAAPKLKDLLLDYEHLNDDVDLTTNPLLKANQLQSLEALDLSHSSITSPALAQLLQAATNLKDLSLYSCKNLTGDINVPANHLQALETLHLSESSLTSPALAQLLQAATNLKNLYLHGCKHLKGDIKLQTNQLPALETLRLSDLSINSSVLAGFLRAAPNLKDLFIDCKNLNDDLDLKTSQLQSLETLHVGGSNITSPALARLLQATPNLKVLDFYFSSTLSQWEIQRVISWCSTGKIRLSPATLSALRAAYERVFLRATSQAPVPFLPTSSATPHASEFEFDKPKMPKHNSKEFKEFTPTPEDKPFHYSGINQSKNQGMVTEKLCQYCTLTQTNLALIPKVQDGICLPLSRLFLEDNLGMAEMLTTIGHWDGSLEKLSAPLKELFNKLIAAIEAKSDEDGFYFIGDHFQDYMDGFKVGESALLANPWHAIGVTRLSRDEWSVYNPNHEDGPRRVTHDALVHLLQEVDLGRLISVNKEDQLSLPTLRIKDPNAFIEHGGLLLITSDTNRDVILKALPKKQFQYSKEAVDGLLHRDINGPPAWALGIISSNEAVRVFTETLLEQFKSHHQNWQVQLQKSMSAMKKKEVNGFMKALSLSSRKEIIRDVAKVFEHISASKKYEAAFKTWAPPRIAPISFLEYAKHCLQPNGQTSRLILCESESQTFNIAAELQEYARGISRPVFYVNNAQDLICSAPYVLRKEGVYGELKPGPGGALYSFLTRYDSKDSVLIVNFDAFTAEEIVRFNTICDANPSVDGVSLPKKMNVIGLINTKAPDCYEGADFYSRFQVRERCPVSSFMPKSALSVSDGLSEAAEDSVVINLYQTQDWAGRLFGRWNFDDKGRLYREQGALQEALTLKKPIVIQNAPLDNPEFQRVMRQAQQGGARYAGEVIQLPQTCTLRFELGYDWENLSSYLTLQELETAEPFHVLNPQLAYRFVPHTMYDGQTLVRHPGLIAEAKTHGNPLRVKLTRTLSDDAFAMLLETCRKENVRLHLECAPEVALPKTLKPGWISKKAMFSPWGAQETQNTAVIQSTDTDTTIAQLTKTQFWRIIDVSELSPSDLLMSLEGAFDQDTAQLRFNTRQTALLTSMEQKEQVILTGRFSKALADYLAPILLGQEHQERLTRLLLVSDDTSLLRCSPYLYLHRVTKEEKKAFLSQPEPLEDYLERESLSKLKAREQALSLHPHAASDEAWAGMTHLAIPSQSEKIDLEDSPQQAQSFHQHRLETVLKHLEKAPTVFLAGLTGTGKTTFVETILAQEKPIFTESQMQAWALADEGGILFIDEANLSHKQWTEFEGLYHKPPSILINGVIYDLTPQHQVIFAGNPISYGDERKLSPFFARHGSSVVFDPLTPAALYEDALKPLFLNSKWSDDEIAQSCFIMLEAYQFLVARSTSFVLVSPRELQMIALLAQVEKTDSTEERLQVTRKLTYELLSPLLPKEYQSSFAERFKAEEPLVNKKNKVFKDFLLTPSRQEIWDTVQRFCALRDWRQRDESTPQQAQLTAGLGGLVIEGESGIGKSELVLRALIASGKKANDDFDYLPASMPTQEKKKALIEAFHAGKIVILDEINCGPTLERLLNGLLMGKNPITGEVAKKPGFFLIGTKNPITMAGRRAPSTALERRLHTKQLPPYTPSEMTDIVMHMGVPADQAGKMIDVFCKQQDFARKNQLTPPPVFRDLHRLASRLKRAKTTLVEEQNLTSTTIQENHHPSTQPRILPKQTTPITNKRAWQIPLVLGAALGFITGVGLCLTGVFSPLGVSLFAISLSGVFFGAVGAALFTAGDLLIHKLCSNTQESTSMPQEPLTCSSLQDDVESSYKKMQSFLPPRASNQTSAKPNPKDSCGAVPDDEVLEQDQHTLPSIKI